MDKHAELFQWPNEVELILATLKSRRIWRELLYDNYHYVYNII